MQANPDKIYRLVTFLGLGRFDPASREYVYDPTTACTAERGVIFGLRSDPRDIVITEEEAIAVGAAK